MSHALALLAGTNVAIAALRTSVAEPGWGGLFLLAFILGCCAWAAANDERKAR